MKVYRESQFSVSPAAILFDTDNTLYPYDPPHAAAMDAVRAKAVASLGIEAADFDMAFESARSEVKIRLGSTAASHSRLLYVQRMLELLGLGSQVLTALDLEQTYWRTFLGSAQLFSGLHDVLDLIRMFRIPTAIVTDLTAQIQFRKVVYFNLDQYFDFIVTSEEAGADKPAAAPFAIAVEKLRPTDGPLWMIGDNPVNDIRGARERVGAVTIQKIHKGVVEGRGEFSPDASFTDYHDLARFLRLMLERSQ